MFMSSEAFQSYVLYDEVIEDFATGRSFVQRGPTMCVCVCVCLCAIRCNNDPLHLQWVGRRDQTKKERKKE